MQGNNCVLGPKSSRSGRCGLVGVAWAVVGAGVPWLPDLARETDNSMQSMQMRIRGPGLQGEGVG